MGKKKRGPDISGMKIFLMVGAAGAAIAAAILGFLAFVPIGKKKDPEPEPGPDQEPDK